MILESSHIRPIRNPTRNQIARVLSHAVNSYVCLTLLDASYLRAIGGPEIFVLEYRNKIGDFFRARKALPSVTTDTASALETIGVLVEPEQQILIKQVVEVMEAAVDRKQPVEGLRWEPMSQDLWPDFRVRSWGD